MKNTVLIYDLQSLPESLDINYVSKKFVEDNIILWTSKDGGVEPKVIEAYPLEYKVDKDETR